MIWRRGERGSGISVLAARHDDDDDIYRGYPSYSVQSDITNFYNPSNFRCSCKKTQNNNYL